MLRHSLALAQVMRDVKRPRNQIEGLAAGRLRGVLVNAYRTVPYYRRMMRETGYDPIKSYNGCEDLGRLRVTTKTDIKTYGLHEFVHEDEFRNLRKYFSDRTSGSTGVPLTVYRSPYERAIQVAKWLRVLFLNGYSARDKVLSFTAPRRIAEGQSLVQRLGLFRRLAVDSTLGAQQLTDAIVRYKPDLIYGVRSVLELAALEFQCRNIRPDSIKRVVVGGETVYEHTRRLIREELGGKVVEMYGSVELGVMAYQTPGSDGMWLSEDLTHFEFLREDGQPAKPGERARIVVTDLTGCLMPFIRYDQGDYGIYTEEWTSEGLCVRKLSQVIGRDDDYAVLSDGSMRTFNTFYETMHGFHDIRQFRVIQKEPDHFQILLAGEPAYIDRISGDLIMQLHAAFPPSVRFELVPVEGIEPDSSGKMRMLISEVQASRRSTTTSMGL